MTDRVLIVDDDTAFVKVIEIRLKAWKDSLQLQHAETIARAREILDTDKEGFFLVILDQHLPDGLGADLFSHPRLRDSTVLAVSADNAPEIPAKAVKAGAQHFLGKRQVTEPLFIPLLEALLVRKEVEKRIFEAELTQSKMSTIKTLLATLRHEINNPLGAVLGGAYLVRNSGSLAAEQAEAVRLIESSGNRIKHVIQQLCEAAELEEVTKGREKVFHVPGDAPWESKKIAPKRPR